MFNKPSFYAHLLGTFMLLFSIIVFYNNYSSISNNPFHLLIIILFFTLLICVHGLSHLGMEHTYICPFHKKNYKKNFNDSNVKWNFLMDQNNIQI